LTIVASIGSMNRSFAEGKVLRSFGLTSVWVITDKSFIAAGIKPMRTKSFYLTLAFGIPIAKPFGINFLSEYFGIKPV